MRGWRPGSGVCAPASGAGTCPRSSARWSSAASACARRPSPSPVATSPDREPTACEPSRGDGGTPRSRTSARPTHRPLRGTSCSAGAQRLKISEIRGAGRPREGHHCSVERGCSRALRSWRARRPCGPGELAGLPDQSAPVRDRTRYLVDQALGQVRQAKIGAVVWGARRTGRLGHAATCSSAAASWEARAADAEAMRSACDRPLSREVRVAARRHLPQHEDECQLVRRQP
jgi:hypothetical protein